MTYNIYNICIYSMEKWDFKGATAPKNHCIYCKLPVHDINQKRLHINDVIKSIDNILLCMVTWWLEYCCGWGAVSEGMEDGQQGLEAV